MGVDVLSTDDLRQENTPARRAVPESRRLMLVRTHVGTQTGTRVREPALHPSIKDNVLGRGGD